MRNFAGVTGKKEARAAVEQGTTEHSTAGYTRDLLDAIPDPYRRLGAKAAPKTKTAAPRKERAAGR